MLCAFAAERFAPEIKEQRPGPYAAVGVVLQEPSGPCPPSVVSNGGIGERPGVLAVAAGLGASCPDK